METAAIIALLEKGFTVVGALYEAGNSEAGKRAIKIVTDFIGLTKAGPVTDASIGETEALLDALLDEFNLPLPEQNN